MNFSFTKNNRVIPWIIGTLGVIFMISFSSEAKNHKSGCAYLGVKVESMDQDEKSEMGVKHGVLVVEVEKDSPAEKAGIKEEDVIQYFNDKKIRKPDILRQRVRESEPESKGFLVIIREGKEIKVEVVLADKKQPGPVWHQSGEFKPFGFSDDRAFLGVKLHPLNIDLASYFGRNENSGALILEIIEDTPAQKAGLKSGDVIISMDENPVYTPDDVIKILKDMEPGDETVCKFVRKGTEGSIEVILDKPHVSSHLMHFSPGSCGSKEFRMVVPDIDSDKIIEETVKMQENLNDLKMKQMQIYSIDAMNWI